MNVAFFDMKRRFATAPSRDTSPSNFLKREVQRKDRWANSGRPRTGAGALLPSVRGGPQTHILTERYDESTRSAPCGWSFFSAQDGSKVQAALRRRLQDAYVTSSKPSGPGRMKR